MMGIHTHGTIMIIAIILPPQKLLPNLQKLKPLPVLQHHQKLQVELVRKQQVVVIQHQHQPVGVQLQMSITQHQVIVTTHLTALIIQLLIVWLLVLDMQVI